MKHQQRVFYLTHSERPALVRGILYLLTLAIPIVSLCLLPVTSFADIQDNVIVKKDATLTIEPGVANALSDNTALSQSFLILRNFLSPETAQETSSRQIRAGSISTNPADVEPFRGTTWEFTYTIINTFTNTISFKESVSVADDGSVLLLGTDTRNGSSAAISYAPSLGEYVIVIEGTTIKELYAVTLDGCCKVQGKYYMTSLDPNFEYPYPLTGTRTSGGPPSTSVVLTVTTSGNGKVTSSVPGIDCGTTCSASYPSQTSVSLIASPAADSQFQQWSGDCTGTSPSVSLVMDATKNCGATFGPKTTSGNGSQPTSNTTLPVSDLEPAADEVPMDYYRDDTTGDVWGPQPAWQLPSPTGKLPTDMWKYGLRSIYLAKYACQDAGIRDWMPTNIANGVYYCTNPKDKQQTISYLRTLAAKLTAENRASSTRANNSQPVSPIEPGSGEVPIDYYRDPTTGDVWGQQPAWQIPAKGTLPPNLWEYGLRSLYLAKYACQDAGVRDWMPTNIANGIYYCTNPQDRAKTISYLLSLADKLEKE